MNQIFSTQQSVISQMTENCSNIDNMDQNNNEQFENAVCSVLNGIINTYEIKNFKGRLNFALFWRYCSSYGHTRERCS